MIFSGNLKPRWKSNNIQSHLDLNPITSPFTLTWIQVTAVCHQRVLKARFVDPFDDDSAPPWCIVWWPPSPQELACWRMLGPSARPVSTWGYPQQLAGWFHDVSWLVSQPQNIWMTGGTPIGKVELGGQLGRIFFAEPRNLGTPTGRCHKIQLDPRSLPRVHSIINWLVVTGCHQFWIFPEILGISSNFPMTIGFLIIPIDVFHIFFRTGWPNGPAVKATMAFYSDDVALVGALKDDGGPMGCFLKGRRFLCLISCFFFLCCLPSPWRLIMVDISANFRHKPWHNHWTVHTGWGPQDS